MQRTISIKIDAPAEFLDYLKACNELYSRYVEWCFETKSYNKNKSHTELYEKFRQEFPSINSATIQCIRDNALESVKALKFKFKPKKKPHSHIRFDKRTIALRGDQLSFAWSGDRIKQIIKIPEFFKKRYGSWKFQAATIGYNKHKKQFVANLIFQSTAPQELRSSAPQELRSSAPQELRSSSPEKKGDRVVGIDRGLYNIVSLSDGFKYASNQVRKVKREVLFLKKQLQTKGTHSAKRKLKALSCYEKRFSLNVNHIISKLLVSLPYDIFVLEDLKGIRKQKSKGKRLNKWLANWSFWQLEALLGYKAEIFCKQIVKVDARYTSQKCCNCGQVEKANRDGSHYHCERCGFRCHSDTNAAKNIRNNYLISAAEKQKAEQAMCQLAECFVSKDTETSPVAFSTG
jgi:IS605 OrfB family transposase